MRILFFSDNFPPECNAPAVRLAEHASRWVRAGHEVTVLTCAPNFPEGKVYPGYRNNLYCSEQVDGIRVVRVKTYISANKGAVRRTLDYASFLVMGLFAGLIQKRPDLVVGTSPQLFAALGACLLAMVRRRPFIFEVRDLWPASIVAVEALPRGLIVRLLSKLELFLYKRAAAVVVVTQSFRSILVARGIPSEKIAVISNGVDLERYTPRAKDEALLDQYRLTGKFVVGYLGTHGMAHALHRVLDAAQALSNRQDIAFLFVGSGSARDELQTEAKKRKLNNVTMVPRQPNAEMPRFWSLCDVALICLKASDAFASVIPSKLFEAMGMGLPIVLATPDGEAATIVRSTGAGVVVPPENPPCLAQTIAELSDDPTRRKAMQCASRLGAEPFSRASRALSMLDVFRSVVIGRSPSVRYGHGYLSDG